jgi:predicted ATPase/DNA-binding winged helix-turn-helix (wHTH) protein
MEEPRQDQVFGAIKISSTARQLWLDEKPQPVGARAFDVLIALAERRGRLVTKDELLEAAWPGRVVGENNLAVQVGTLRKLLGAGVIATIPGRGYSFTPPESALASQDAQISVPTTLPPETPRANLPAELPVLIGRDDDVALLGELLIEHRLVTIVGPGGIGKTRLAQGLLNACRGSYAHGVAWVELASLAEPDQVVGTIARTLGLEVGGADPLSGLVDALAPLDLLLGLDNAEHVADEAARVVEALLARAPKVSVLVTSQTPLKLSAEQVVRLGPLAVPPQPVMPPDAMRYGAVALFVQRARAVERSFALDDRNVGLVIEVCRRLDGIPLAIEMAAARISVMGLAALSTGLDNQLQLLTSRRRDLPQRQQTLRAALEWSHGLLRPGEQAALRRLGVFVGGCTLEMALQVAAESPREADRWEALDALGELVDHSLVMIDADENPRYRLLESTRAFALEQLQVAGEESAIRARHAAVVRRAFDLLFAQRLYAADSVRAEMQLDIANARAAIGWALHNDPVTAVALAFPYAYAAGRSSTASVAQVWSATRALLNDGMPIEVRAEWMLGSSLFWAASWLADRPHRARTAVSLWRQVEDRNGLLLALLALANTSGTPPTSEGTDALNEALTLDGPGVPPVLRSHIATATGKMKLNVGLYDEALPALQRALDWAMTGKDSRSQNLVIDSIITAQLTIGDLTGAIDNCILLQERLRRTRNDHDLTFVLGSLTVALLGKDEVAGARRVAQEAWPLAVAQDTTIAFNCCLPLLAVLESRFAESAMLFGYAEAADPDGLAQDATSVRAMAKAQLLAREHLGSERFEALRLEGASLQQHQIPAIAFGLQSATMAQARADLA